MIECNGVEHLDVHCSELNTPSGHCTPQLSENVTNYKLPNILRVK